MSSTVRSAGTVQALRSRLDQHLTYSVGRTWADATPRDTATAAALAIRQRIIDTMIATEQRYTEADAKRVYYLSIEFLLGRALGNNLCNLGEYDAWRDVAAAAGLDFEAMLEAEPDPALGNGGLGRLAACFLDSFATLGLPGIGYGINYEFGLFRQRIEDGHQQERPDRWPGAASPWLLERIDESVLVPVYGRIEHTEDTRGDYNPLWLDWQVVVGVPHDVPIVGYGGRTVNVLRLFSARASDDFDMRIFNDGDYVRAIEEKISSETISKVLYPPDALASGRELRLLQEYFLVACALRDIVRRYRRQHTTFDLFPARAAIQLNDTHPALAVPELMRILVDEHALAWDEAWAITRETFGYTNHTLLPEALERWPVPLLERVLPRHLQIIYEINRRFLEEAAALAPGDAGLAQRTSIIEESEPKQVRMAHLAIIGSHSINGVAALHSDLVKRTLVPDFYRLWPERFNNKTNGITPRRWLLKANPGLAALLTDAVGPGWVTDLSQLRAIESHVDDAGFRDAFMAVKHANKAALARVIRETTSVSVNPASMFDVQAKRIHEYKRQLLNALHVAHQYLAIVDQGVSLPSPKTYVFAGKAAPGYFMAKLIIKLINSIADTVNSDTRVREQLRVVFIPDYRVSLAERIVAAADLSEQISTAGKEASGTGNMKFALNGAVTIGTLDGANVEIREEVGDDNIYIFGLTIDLVEQVHRDGYDPGAHYRAHPGLAHTIDAIRDGRFWPRQRDLFHPLVHQLLGHDPYLHLADFSSYADAHARALETFGDQDRWARQAMLNTARVGFFSSDRTVSEYARDIWRVEAI